MKGVAVVKVSEKIVSERKSTGYREMADLARFLLGHNMRVPDLRSYRENHIKGSAFQAEADVEMCWDGF